MNRVRTVVVIGGHADVGVLSGGGSAQVEAPGGSPVAPPPSKDPLAAFIRPVWIRSSPLRALTQKLPDAKISYISGDDPATAAAAAKQADVAIVFVYQWEAENSDLSTLDLAAEQNKLSESGAMGASIPS